MLNILRGFLKKLVSLPDRNLHAISLSLLLALTVRNFLATKVYLHRNSLRLAHLDLLPTKTEDRSPDGNLT